MKNYKLIKEEFISDIKTKAKVYEHIKTKAKVCTLENDDNNKVFTIGFRTPAVDNTGLTHILEHSVLCGSKKYPVKEPFVDLMKGSLKTFLNASTYPDKTVYPIASCNEIDFDNLTSVYLDAVFNPSIYKHKEIFLQEGWIHKLDNEDDDITINGVVYNEMKGATSSVEDIMNRRILASIYPDTTYKFNSGGDPLYIPELTYEKFLDFHKKYYHPTNSFTIFYGNCNMEEKLENLDKEYLSNYEYSDFDTTVKPQKPLEKTNVLKVEYAVAKTDSLENKTNMSLNFAVGDFDDIKLKTSFSILAYVLLTSDVAYVKNALNKANIAQNITGNYRSGINKGVFSIIIKNSNEDKLDVFNDVVDKALKDVVKNGIDKEMITSIISSMEFNEKESSFSLRPLGLQRVLSLFNTWLYDDNNQLSSLYCFDLLKELKELTKTNYFEDLIVKYLINNKHRSNVVCIPSYDVQIKRDEDLKNKLSTLKSSLSKTKVNDLINQSKQLREYQEEILSDEILASIPKISKEQISTEVEKLNSELKMIDNYKVYHQEYDTSDIDYIDFNFDITNITKENLSFAKLLTLMLKRNDTKNYELTKLNSLIMKTSGDFNVNIKTLNKIDNTSLAMFDFNVSCLSNNLEDVLNLLLEVKDNTIFDEKRLYDILLETKNNLIININRSGNAYASLRLSSYLNEKAYYDEIVSGVSFLDFITNLIDNYKTEYKNIINKFNFIKETYFTKENLIISYTGLNLNNFTKNMNIFTNSLNDKFNVNDNIEFKINILNEGIKTPGSVQYVALGGNFKNHNIEYTGAFAVLKTLLKTDYLWQEVRIKGGAYGCALNAEFDGTLVLTSYRDPNLVKTINTFKNSIDYLNNINLNDEELLKVIVGTIGALDMPKHVSAKAITAFNNNLIGVSYEQLCKIRNEVLNVTVDDLKSLAKILVKVFSDNAYCIIGNDSVIEGNKEVFNNIRKL